MRTSSTASIQPIEDIDSACLRALAEGDQAAFAQIVDRWQTRLINFFYRATGNRADAEDLAQETFIELNRAATAINRRALSAHLSSHSPAAG